MRSPLLGLFCALLVTCATGSSLVAQVPRPDLGRKARPAGVAVTSSTPSRLEVFQGHSAEVIVHGTGLMAVSGAEVLQGGAPVPGVSARLGTGAGLRTSSDTDLTLTLVTEGDAQAGGPYQLRLRTREEWYAVPSGVLSVFVNILYPPKVTAFWINGRENETKSTHLTLHFQALYAPTHYRACATWGATQCISTAKWQALRGNSAGFDLEPLCNDWKVYFQLKNEGGESIPASVAGIRFYRIEYIDAPVSGASAWQTAKANGFRFSARALDDNARCDIDAWGSSLMLRVQKKNALLGAKCEFELFAGRQLHEDYSFFGYADESDSSPLSGFRIVGRPARGSRDMRTVIRGWIEPGATAFHYYIEEFHMNGPCHLDSAIGAWQ